MNTLAILVKYLQKQQHKRERAEEYLQLIEFMLK